MSAGGVIFKIATGCRRALGWQLPRAGPQLYQAFWRVAPATAEVELLPGVFFKADFRDHLRRATWWQGVRFEAPTPQVLAHFAEAVREPVFFDIGANYGFFSYWMATRPAPLRAHAFEPHPAVHALLTATRDRNSLDQLTPHQFALGDEPGTLDLHAAAADSGRSTFGTPPGAVVAVTHRVEVKTFDTWRREAGLELPPEPRWIAKIDVEGFEPRVLRGMREALAARAFALLCVEINIETLAGCGFQPADAFAVLREAGYVRIEETALARRWPVHRTNNAFFLPATPVEQTSDVAP
jgi:FkbM family methyltransferase